MAARGSPCSWSTGHVRPVDALALILVAALAAVVPSTATRVLASDALRLFQKQLAQHRLLGGDANSAAALHVPNIAQNLTLPAGSMAWAPMIGIGTIDSTKAASYNPMQVADCINEKYEMKNMTWATAMADDLASVKVAGIWWTAKQRRVPVTLVTQSSVDRIPQLHAQCKSWHGPLSVVMYLGLQQDTLGGLTPENHAQVFRALQHVHAFFYDIEHDEASCKPDIMLVYEVYTERKAMLLYPINLLRNLARLQARTPLLALVDVDMLLSNRFHEDLQNPEFANKLLQMGRNKTAFVLPAFETYGQHVEAAAIADMLATRDKAFLVECIGRSIAGPFDSKRFVLGHNCTDFKRWYGSSEEYEIKYGERYEPWVVVDRYAAPWHDVRFRGYGNNKIQHICHLNSTGFKFVVLSDAFIIHRAHQETSVRLRLVASKAAYDTAKALNQPVDTTSVYGHTRTLFDNAKAQMAYGGFKAVIDNATDNCRGKLDWWMTAAQREAKKTALEEQGALGQQQPQKQRR